MSDSWRSRSAQSSGAAAAAGPAPGAGRGWGPRPGSAAPRLGPGGGGGWPQQQQAPQPPRGAPAAPAELADGVIAKLLRDKGFGFIRPVPPGAPERSGSGSGGGGGGGGEVFFAFGSGLARGLCADDLFEGMRVRYGCESAGAGGRTKAYAVEKAPRATPAGPAVLGPGGSVSLAPAWVRSAAAGEAAAAEARPAAPPLRLGPPGWAAGGGAGGGSAASAGGSAGAVAVRPPPLSDLACGGACAHGAASRWFDRLLAAEAGADGGGSAVALLGACAQLRACLDAAPPFDVLRRALSLLGRRGLTGSLLCARVDALFLAVLESNLVRASHEAGGESALAAYCAALPEQARKMGASQAECLCADALSLLTQLHARFGPDAHASRRDDVALACAAVALPGVAVALRVALRSCPLPLALAECCEDSVELLLRAYASHSHGKANAKHAHDHQAADAGWAAAAAGATPGGGEGSPAAPPASVRLPWAAWRTLSVFPLACEVLSAQGAQPLQSNRVREGYGSLCEYVGTHFWLLREDCVAPLREGIAAYRAGALDGRDMAVYTGVRVERLCASRLGVTYALSFDAVAGVNWAACKRLLFGSLLCLSRDGFEGGAPLLWATVAEREAERCEGALRPEVCVRLADGGLSDALSAPDGLGGCSWTMVESPAYFEVRAAGSEQPCPACALAPRPLARSLPCALARSFARSLARSLTPACCPPLPPPLPVPRPTAT
jgi:hypothetical protein